MDINIEFFASAVDDDEIKGNGEGSKAEEKTQKLRAL
jgi:hypothetical protein